MNTQEALMVLRKVIAYQPNQRMDELTREAWAEALESYDVRDALDAVKKLAVAPREPGQPFWMEVRDIVQEVRSMEQGRYYKHQHLAQTPPREVLDLDDIQAERDWLRSMSKKIRSRDFQPPAAIEPDAPNAEKSRAFAAELAARTRAEQDWRRRAEVAMAHHNPETCEECA